MDRIEKFVRTLGKDKAMAVRAALVQIYTNDLATLDVRKLKGEKSLYRVRIGKIRIQFIRTSVGNHVINIGFRGDDTY